MILIKTHDSAEAHKSFRDGAAKLYWVGAIANGAAMLGMGQLIGSLDDPDYALRAMFWPLVGSGTGLMFGLLALLVGQIALLRAVSAGAYLDAHNFRESAAKDLTEKARREAGEAFPLTQRTAREKDERLATATEFEQQAKEDMRSYLRASDREFKASSGAIALSVLSCLCLGASLITALSAHHGGQRLQPRKDEVRVQTSIRDVVLEAATRRQ